MFQFGECTITLEDVEKQLSLPTISPPITRPTLSNFSALQDECMLTFGTLAQGNCRDSFINLMRLLNVKHRLELADHLSWKGQVSHNDPCLV
ncbi:hypothetical protein AHAS_Ahas06G0199200 [Arachis hypogaea]